MPAAGGWSGLSLSLATRAAEVLRRNDRGGYTVPSQRLYPHQWAWDSAFAAVGWAWIDPARAVRELEILLAGQWPDGRVPHILFHRPSADYFPGPDFWEREGSSTITQPPAWALAARILVERGLQVDRVRGLIPALDLSHRFFHEHRDPLGWGAVAVAHPWESGMDNSPAWDGAMRAIDPSEAPPFRRVDRERVEDASQRPTDEDYRRYAVLVKAIARDGFGPGRFAVYDPFMTALLARAEGDLAWLSAELGVPTGAAGRAERLTKGLLAHLWDDEAGRFRFHDARADRPYPVEHLAAYAPLFLELPAEVRPRLEAGLRERYLTAWPLPTVPPGAPGYDPICYWRGPTWINMNWLLAPVLGRPLVDRTLELVERSGFYEYFHPETGKGLGADEFSWTAALVLDLTKRSG